MGDNNKSTKVKVVVGLFIANSPEGGRQHEIQRYQRQAVNSGAKRERQREREREEYLQSTITLTERLVLLRIITRTTVSYVDMRSGRERRGVWHGERERENRLEEEERMMAREA